MPSVRLPSLIVGSKSPSVIAALNSATVRSSRSGSIAEPRGQLAQRTGVDAGRSGRLVVDRAQHLHRAGVEDLRRDALRLAQHLGAVLGVGVVAEVGALVDEALAVRVDHDRDGIGLARVAVGELAVARRRRARVPLDRVAAAPVPVGLGAVRQRRAQDLAGVVGRAAHLGHVPVRPEVGRAHLRVGLEAARGEHDSARAQDLARPTGVAHGDAADGTVVAAHEILDRGAMAQLDPVAFGGGAVLDHQPLPAIDRARPRARPRSAGGRRPRWTGARTSGGSAAPCRAASAPRPPSRRRGCAPSPRHPAPASRDACRRGSRPPCTGRGRSWRPARRRRPRRCHGRRRARRGRGGWRPP